MTTQAQGKSGRMAWFSSSLAMLALIFAVSCGEKPSNTQPTASGSGQQTANSTASDRIEKRRRECEPLKPILEQFAYLEAGFSQGINQHDFIESQRRIEAEFIKLGGGTDAAKLAPGAQVPDALRSKFQLARISLGTLKLMWETPVLKDGVTQEMKRDAPMLQYAREDTANYIQGTGMFSDSK